MNNESLLQAFEPPEGYFGQVCICCALSADQVFMEDAVERFSKHYDGAPCVYMMLDRTGSILNCESIPGLVQLQAKSNQNIRIQHAKVALMQFGRARGPIKLRLTNDTVWRLVVSTGNWTKESACNNIEMVWKADFFTKMTEINMQLLADLICANDFFMNLRKHYVCNEVLWKRAEMLGDCLKQFKEKNPIEDVKKTRFISTISGTTLMTSIQYQFMDGIKRNFIQVGSGFYERGSDSSSPEIIQTLDRFLKNRDVFSIRPLAKKIVVNKDHADRLAFWDKCFWNGWKLFDVMDPIKTKEKNAKRKFLHAKYICLGNKKKKEIKDCKFYIGSGNLTRMGLLSAYGKNPSDGKGSGNIEAGIVVDVEPECAKVLLATCGKEIKKTDELDKQVRSEDAKMPIPVCPLNAFELDDNLLTPVWNDYSDVEDVKTPCIVITNAGENTIQPFSNQIISYPESRPIYILVKRCEHHYWIPVITKEGILPLPAIKVNSIEDVLDSIAEFPGRPNFDEDEDPPNGGGVKHISIFHENEQQESFPIYLSMKLVEGIAKCNESITDDVIDCWISYLEQYLNALPQEKLNELKAMKINFFNVLKRKNFAPSLRYGKSQWNDFVNKMSKKWGMTEWIGLK